jgi:hypothetical protein
LPPSTPLIGCFIQTLTSMTTAATMSIRQPTATLIGGFHLVPTLDLKPVMYEKAEQIMPWNEANHEVYINSEQGSF